MSKLNKNDLQLATLNALANWSRYRSDYEFFKGGGDWKERPLFKFKDLRFKDFDSFCNDYGLSRNIRHKDNVAVSAKGLKNAEKRKNAEDARDALCKFLKGLDPNCRTDVGNLSDTLGEWAKSTESVLDGPKKGKPFLVSLCSKVMSFVDPAEFPPFDRLGRRGVFTVAENLKPGERLKNRIPYGSYEDYKKDFDKFFKKVGVKAEINAELDLHNIFTESRQHLMPRVLDKYCMIVGAFR